MSDVTHDATAPHWDVQCEQRRITIAEFSRQAAPRLEIALDHGRQAQLVLTEATSAAALAATLARLPQVGLLPAEGGLPATLPVAESLALALTWEREPALGSSWDPRLELAFGLCGFTLEESSALSRGRPLDLPRSIRWRLGLVRYLVRPPELLVLDRVFAGLAPAEAGAVRDGIAAFHALYPFRAMLRIDLAADDARHAIAPMEVA